MIDAAGHTTTYGYDAMGQATGHTDANGGSLVWSDDAMGNRTAQYERFGSGFDAVPNRTTLTTDGTRLSPPSTPPTGRPRAAKWDPLASDLNGARPMQRCGTSNDSG